MGSRCARQASLANVLGKRPWDEGPDGQKRGSIVVLVRLASLPNRHGLHQFSWLQWLAEKSRLRGHFGYVRMPLARHQD